MAQSRLPLPDKLLFQQTLARWTRAADAAGTAQAADLAALTPRAEALHDATGTVLAAARARQETALLDPTGPDLVHGGDWGHRPDLWALPQPAAAAIPAVDGASVGETAHILHNGSPADVMIRQRTGLPGGAPCAVQLDVLGFEGDYLFVSLPMPAEGAQGLTRDHIIQLDLTITATRRAEVYARLSVEHGPNTEEVTDHIRAGSEETDPSPRTLLFDLQDTDLNEKRVSGLRLDLMFADARANRYVISDLVLSRHLRADL